MLKPIKGNPGRFLDTDSGKVINISEYREDDKYDTVGIVGDGETIAEGTQYYFFRDLVRKQAIDTNFTQPSRLGAGEKMVVDRIGLSVEAACGNKLVIDDDVLKIISNAHLRINVNSLLLTEGPAIKYASGYGYSGMSSAFGLVSGGSILNIGTPSPAAVSRLLKTQTLTAEHEILGMLTFFTRNWINALFHGSVGEDYVPPVIDTEIVLVKCWLHGLFKTAVNK